MSGSADLQPQKRILLAEDLLPSSSKKPRFLEETSTPQAESSSANPPSLAASSLEDANNTVIKEFGVPVADGEGELIQPEKVNRPSSSEVGNQSTGKKKRIRPPRAGRQSRNEEDKERGTLVSPTPGELEPKALRLPKRLCALLLGFCGSGYRGMQM